MSKTQIIRDIGVALAIIIALGAIEVLLQLAGVGL